MSNLDN